MTSFEVQVYAERDIPQETREMIAQWAEVIFGEEERKYAWASVDWRILLQLDGQWACHAAISERTALAGNVRVRLGGIGGVMTPPAFRGRGLAAQVMMRAAELMTALPNVDFGLLLCNPDLIPWYARLGWKEIAEPLYFEQPGRKARWPEAAMILECGGAPWPGGSVDLCGLPW